MAGKFRLGQDGFDCIIAEAKDGIHGARVSLGCLLHQTGTFFDQAQDCGGVEDTGGREGAVLAE